MKEKSTGFCLKLIGGPLGKGWKITKTATCVFAGNFCAWRGTVGFWVKLMGTTLGQRLENHQKSNLCVWRGLPLLMFWAVSCFCCWCFELYHGFVADVLSCIRFPLLMFWAASRFCCWCLELYQVSVADVLTCIMLLLLMSWAVSCFCCWRLELYHAIVADVLSCITFPLLMSWAESLCDSGFFNIIHSCFFFIFLKKSHQFEFRVSGWQIPLLWPP